jgi:uncharacterized protein (TIGR02996 family)
MSHPAFTDDDKVFLRAIMANPAELTAWLAYADWLEERGDPRAEFIRLEVRRGQLRATQAEWGLVESRLRELRESLDADWIAVFDRPPIENCDEAFAFQCPKQWENLGPTADPAVRRCAGCRKLVYYCRTVGEAREHARQGHCVEVQLGLLRFPDDLDSLLAFGDDEVEMGDFAPDYDPGPEPRPWWKFW